jgi:periplasmic divalent cation tolerance protein
MDPVIIMTNFPDRVSALALAKELVEQRLAACVNVLSECSSVYRWKNEIERADEVPVLIKTLSQNYPQVESLVRRMHPYELPEIIAVPVVEGFPGYMQWIADECMPPPDKT